MDPKNLHTASLYVNNLLLSRGLLRDGTPIEFAKPSKAEGGANAAMAQIINLVHDLVLRRDRETDTLSTLSYNMQTLRSTAAQQLQAVSRLELRNADLERQLALSVAQERTAKATLRSAESRNRALREDVARLKLSVSQIRNQCANDIRKRDSEIKRLKKHLEGRRGREGNGGQVGVVVVTPGNLKGYNSTGPIAAPSDPESPSYSLKNETNEFLTHLSQTLSNENDALTCLVQTTLATLRTLQGLPEAGEHDPDSHTRFDTNSEYLPDPNVTLTSPPSYETLATSTDTILTHLRTLLTNPSFVPLEELEVREDEIARLRAGWERMESRWREAVAMMDGWRKRMVETGDTINLEDLRRGLILGEEVMHSDISQGEDLSAQEQELGEESLVDEANRSFETEGDGEGLDALPLRKDNELGIGLFPAPNILKPASGNVRRSLSPRKSSPRLPTAPEPSDPVDLVNTSDDLLLDFSNATPSRSGPKRSWHRNDVEVYERPLTVQQKLENAQLEAEDARKRDLGAGVAVRRTGLPKLKAKASRRRSTLSPEELEGLMGLV